MDDKSFKDAKPGARFYSSHGEDANFFGVLNRLTWLMQKDYLSSSTYLDIGSHDPVTGSNTYALYLANWRGTLVEPNRYWHELYKLKRPGDYFLECAVAPERGQGKMFWFSDLASSNTLSKDFALRISQSQNVPIENELTVDLITLSDSIDIHREIFSEVPNLVSIDVEGMDYDIMSTFDFSTRPLFFMIEDPDIDGPFNEGKLQMLLRNVDYRPVSHNLLTTLFIDSLTPESRALLEIGPRNL